MQARSLFVIMMVAGLTTLVAFPAILSFLDPRVLGVARPAADVSQRLGTAVVPRT